MENPAVRRRKPDPDPVLTVHSADFVKLQRHPFTADRPVLLLQLAAEKGDRSFHRHSP